MATETDMKIDGDRQRQIEITTEIEWDTKRPTGRQSDRKVYRYIGLPVTIRF